VEGRGADVGDVAALGGAIPLSFSGVDLDDGRLMDGDSEALDMEGVETADELVGPSWLWASAGMLGLAFAEGATLPFRLAAA